MLSTQDTVGFLGGRENGVLEGKKVRKVYGKEKAILLPIDVSFILFST